MNNKQFQIFIGIMNKLDQPSEKDIDKSAHVLYDELCPVPSKQVHLVFPKPDKEKESQSLVSRSEFYETFRNLAAEYSKDWIHHQLKENAQKKLQTTASQDIFEADKLFQDSISSTISWNDTIKLPTQDTIRSKDGTTPSTKGSISSAKSTIQLPTKDSVHFKDDSLPTTTRSILSKKDTIQLPSEDSVLPKENTLPTTTRSILSEKDTIELPSEDSVLPNDNTLPTTSNERIILSKKDTLQLPTKDSVLSKVETFPTTSKSNLSKKGTLQLPTEDSVLSIENVSGNLSGKDSIPLPTEDTVLSQDESMLAISQSFETESEDMTSVSNDNSLPLSTVGEQINMDDDELTLTEDERTFHTQEIDGTDTIINNDQSLKMQNYDNMESPTKNSINIAEKKNHEDLQHQDDAYDSDTSLDLVNDTFYETEMQKIDQNPTPLPSNEMPKLQESEKEVTSDNKTAEIHQSEVKHANKRRLEDSEDSVCEEGNGPTKRKQRRFTEPNGGTRLKIKTRRSRTKSRKRKEEITPAIPKPSLMLLTDTATLKENTFIVDAISNNIDVSDQKILGQEIDNQLIEKDGIHQIPNTPKYHENINANLSAVNKTKDTTTEASIPLSNVAIQTDTPHLTDTDATLPENGGSNYDKNLKSAIQSALESCEFPTLYKKELDRIQTIEQTLLATAHQLEQNQPFLKDLQEQRDHIVRNQEMLQDILSNLQEVLKLNQSLFNLNLTDKDNIDPKQKADILEMQKLQMEHDLKLKQIQSAIDIEEIKAKSQAYHVKSQHEIGVGKLELEKWKTELQNAMSAETLFKNQEHQFRVMKVQSEIDSERQRQKDMQSHLDNERDRIFQKEMQEHKFQHATRLDEIDKQFRQLQQMQKEAHESKINERDVIFKTNLQNLKHDHEAFIEINKQKFNTELEERKISSNEALTEHKLLMEKYKADLLADIKWQQVKTQDENEKMKIQLKMAELEMKLQDATMKTSSNKLFFRHNPQHTSSFEHQMESSAEIAPHSQVKAFERLWNLQYETGMQSSRTLKLKKELISAGKKSIENVAEFNSYLSADLTDWVITRRLDFCEKFNRQGMFLFKTGANFIFSKHRLTKAHIDMIEQSPKSSSDYVYSRYKVSENGKYIIDSLEFMNTWLLFPINANYQIDLTRNSDIEFNGHIYNCMEVIDDIFHGRKLKSAIYLSDMMAQQTTSKPKRSTPIYVSDNVIHRYNLRNKPEKQTRTQIFV